MVKFCQHDCENIFVVGCRISRKICSSLYSEEEVSSETSTNTHLKKKYGFSTIALLPYCENIA
jgi:hypothetical protein